MNDLHATSITQIKEFLKLNSVIEFKVLSKKERNEWLEQVLIRFRYFRLRKKQKSIVRKYILKMTGLSSAQLTRLIERKKKIGKIFLESTNRHSFSTKYSPKDIALLVETDNLHFRLSGPATKKILEREYKVFNRKEYQNISNISSSHIYNLRKTRQYQSHSLTIKKKQVKAIPIGERKKPRPEGKPGYLRIDSVHQGDLDKEKGVYHINIIDEVTQWEILGCTEGITEYFLIPLLEDLINQFPFKILGFHSDNGSEFINKRISQLLNKLFIRQTKSRARHCNDNALIEGKNGSIIRKYVGHRHIPKKYARFINQFYKKYFNIYLNYHRPCGYTTIKFDKKGKEKKIYNLYLTPYEFFKKLPNVSSFLKKGISLEDLDKIAYAMSDNEFASLIKKSKEELFNNFYRHKLQFPTIYTTAISCSYVD